MTPERVAGLVARWARFYTRDLPAPIAERRVDEIDADLHDHLAHERAHGISDRRIARGIASRMVRGLAADVAWRGRQAELAARPSTREETMKMSKAVYRSAVRVAVGVAFILSVPFVASLVADDVVWSLWDFVAAGVFLAAIGIVIELALKRVGNLALAIAIAVVGVLAGVAGEADDAPGLVLLGIVLVVSACALGVRSRTRPPQHSR
jgi:hypothetical protein